MTSGVGYLIHTLPFWPAILAIALGNLVGGLFMALHSAQGPRLGVPQMIQSRAQYGTYGALLVVAVVVFMYIGFFSSNLILGGQSLNQLVSGVSIDWGIVISGVGSLLITIFGYNLIGFAVEIPFINTTFYEGSVAKALNGTDLSWLVGLVVTVPLYYFSAVRRG